MRRSPTIGVMASRDDVLVSVIIPAYNAGPYLRAAVAGILTQTHPHLELIVVDDGSTDGSVDAIAGSSDPRLTIIRQANAGKSAAMNRGLDVASGAFYAVQDSDDLSMPTRIERQLGHLLAHPELAGVFCGWNLILDGRPTAPQHRWKSAEECRRELEALRIPTHDGTPMYRRERLGGIRYDESVRIGESIDYLFRSAEAGGLYEVIGECLYSYRIRPESLCHDDPEARDALVDKVLDAARVRRGLPPAPSARRRLRSANAARDNNIASYFMESVIDQRGSGERMGAITTALRCSALHPLDPHYHKALVYSVMPRPVIGRLRTAG